MLNGYEELCRAGIQRPKPERLWESCEPPNRPGFPILFQLGTFHFVNLNDVGLYLWCQLLGQRAVGGEN